MSLDESTPNTYLDELSRNNEADSFTPPNPKWPIFDQIQRASFIAIGGGVIYLIANQFTEFDIYGVWPGLLSICAGVASLIWRTAKSNDDFDDGATL